MRKYFYTDGENKFGPFAKEKLLNQNISRDTKVWYYGLETWTKLSEIGDFEEELKNIPPGLKPRIERGKGKNEKQTNTKREKAGGDSYKWIIGLLLAIVVAGIAYSYFTNNAETETEKEQSAEKEKTAKAEQKLPELPQKSFYEEVVEKSYNGDEDFNMYITKFYRDVNIYGIYPKRPSTIIIKFARLDQMDRATHVHGVSFGLGDDDRIEIYINPSSWKDFSKPMRYILMYHELAHDILNLKDLEPTVGNKGRLMYPEISKYEGKDMDDFIESYHELFEEIAK